MSKKNDWKRREGIVYSTQSDYTYNYDNAGEAETRPVSQQRLRIALDKSGRAGKQVTLVSGFVGTQDDLAALARELKTRCGVGGSAKEGVILIQGDFRNKIAEYLKKKGYSTRA